VPGAIVFFMQAGFSMLEVGAVRAKNGINILYKNILDASVAALGFWYEYLRSLLPAECGHYQRCFLDMRQIA
jgi:ammonia channel protein AmtB